MIRWPVDSLPAPIGLFSFYLMHPQASELFKVVEKGRELIYLLLTYLKPDVPINVSLLTL